MITIADDTIEIVSDFINYDITSYLENYTNFIDEDYVKLENFYLGSEEDKNQTAQSNLDALLVEGNKVNELMRLNLHNFQRGDFVNLMELLDETFYNIKAINILSKFLRSSLTDTSRSSSILINRIVSSHETPEMVAENERNDWMDSWVDIYIKNRKLETDYDENEGYVVQLNKSIYTNFTLLSVLDNLQGENLYGKDIDKNIDFVDDGSTQDFKVLDGISTFQQSVEIIGSLERRDIPSNPELGLDTEFSKGVVDVNLPLIIRNKQKDFSMDDTLLNFKVTDVAKENGRLNIYFEVESFYSVTKTTQVTL